MWHKTLRVYVIGAASLFTIGLLTSYSGLNKKEKLASPENSLPQVIKSVNVNRGFTFADEPVPTDNFDARERLERELLINSYGHATTMINLKRTSRYFPMIEKELRENGLPDDLKYFPVIESNLSNAVSPAGARGLWQFMKSSAEYYGLEVNEEIDERYHIEKSTKAAIKYLGDLKKRFGNWSLVAAAYNLGPTRLANDVRAQRAETYYELNLPEETNRYFFRLLAVKDIFTNPQQYGFYVDSQTYQPLDNYQTIEITGPIPSLGDFAKTHHTSYRMLKLYNPWLIDTKLSNRLGKKYEIRIPK
jgi:membrane-bound lytic murein transglycosylase D